jgi:hypothetical protein
LKGVGKIFSKIFLTGVWGGAPIKQKTKTKRIDSGLKRDVNLLLFPKKNYLIIKYF